MNAKPGKQEKKLMDSVGRGEWRSMPNLEKEKRRHQKFARDSMMNHAKATIRTLKQRKTG